VAGSDPLRYFFPGLIGRSWTRRTTTLWVQPICIARAGTHDSRIAKKNKMTSWTRIGHFKFDHALITENKMMLMKAIQRCPEFLEESG
jgi:hypothetical protein